MKLVLNDLPCLVVGRKLQMSKQDYQIVKSDQISIINTMLNNYEEFVVVKYGGRRNIDIFGKNFHLNFSYDIIRGIYKACLGHSYYFLQIIKIVKPLPKYKNFINFAYTPNHLTMECDRLGIHYNNNQTLILIQKIKDYWEEYFQRSEPYQIEGISSLIQPEKTIFDDGRIY